MSSPHPDLPLFDAGLQPERTALAWRRTALALAAVALVSVRVVPALAGPWAYLPTGAGLVLSVTILVRAQLRYRHLHHALVEHRRPDRQPDGRLVALTGAATLLIGLAALALTLALAGGGTDVLTRLF